MKVEDFYDDFATQQSKTGINLRHLRILEHLRRFGLQRTHKVLEIGCGIGTVTRLLSDFLRDGSVVGVDISPQSIETARRRLGSRTNVALVVSDMSDFQSDEPFDFVVMPDVLEHIPPEQHEALFVLISNLLGPKGTLVIHIPNPHFLDWLTQNDPSSLQVIDLPVHTHELAPRLHRAGLDISHMETYSLFNDSPDYRLIVVRPETIHPGRSPRGKYRLGSETMLSQIRRRI